MASVEIGQPADAVESRGELRFLLEAADVLNSARPFTDRLNDLLHRLAERLGADGMTLCICGNDDAEGRHELVFARAGDGTHTARVAAHLGLRQEVLNSATTLRIDDAATAAGFRGTLEAPFGITAGSLLAVPLVGRDGADGLLVAVRERREPFSLAHQELLETVAERVAVATHTEKLLRALQRDLEARELLLRISRDISRTLDLDTVLEGVFDALAAILPLDAAVILLLDESGQRLRLSAQRGYVNELAIREVGLETGIVGLVQREARGMIVDRVRDHPSYVEVRPETRSEMALPIVTGGRVIGVINVESDKEGAYNDGHLHLGELVAGQVSSAVANARLHLAQVQRGQVEHELALAREIQQGLLPGRSILPAGLELDAINLPSSYVGGDYYDYIVAEDGSTVLLVLADVAGHGLAASLLMASLQAGFQLLADAVSDPVEIANRLNKALVRATPTNRYVSAVIAQLDLELGILKYCNAGHLPPTIIGASGATRRLDSTGLPLGIDPQAVYQKGSLRLEAGDLMAFYTDGIPEAEGPDGEQLGVEALERILLETSRAGFDAITGTVRARLREHRGRSGEYEDDVTLMVARWTPPARS